ncbi:MAG: methionine gamma-lyase family protein [Firmicutes bacterium]|nr:methionine gamma-lyase family protein [Bacillota bacterium]
MISKAILTALGIPEAVSDYCHQKERELRPAFQHIEEIAEANQAKVLAAFQKHRVSENHFETTTGYGYNDLGRDTLEAVFAEIFRTEDALVRPQLICGTHALSTALFGCLRAGDELLYASGEPYDTLQGVIGIRPEMGSLADYGITYNQVELTPEGLPDPEAVVAALKPQTRLVGIQRSKGYLVRHTLAVDEIGSIIRAVKAVRPDIICMVDNCYGEFTEAIESTEVGADLCVGSLIKNLGGGLAPIGGYIVGRHDLIERCAVRLTAPGLGKEQGPTLGVNRSLYQGLFEAPSVVEAAVKTAVFAAKVFGDMGFAVYPGPEEVRHDIVQTVTLGDPKLLEKFCEGIQAASPVDSFVTPIPWDMPGYGGAQVIMAAGNFISGATIELSADAPMREPYVAFMQGALTWEHGKIGVMKALATMDVLK